MQALTLPARRGHHWFFEGFAIFRKKPLMLAFPVLGYVTLIALIKSLPIIGQTVAALVIPIFSVSLMNACRLIEQGDRPSPQILFSGFLKNARVLFTLGIVYVLVATVIFGLATMIDDGALFQLVILGHEPSEEILDSGKLMLTGQMAMVLFVPLIMSYWYAPVLVAWHDLPAGKALFFSFVACARNWRAFLFYAATTIVYGVFLPGLMVALLIAALSVGGNLISIVLAALIALVLLPTLYASFYVSYRDVFVTINEDA